MKTITEMADDCANSMEGASEHEKEIARRAFDRGVKEASLLGSLTLAEAAQYTMAVAVLRAETPEQEAQFKATADALLEASKTIATLFDTE